MSRYRLLIADDEPGVRELLNYVLGAEYDVVICEDGDAALAHLERSSFDVLLLDLSLPGRDGISVLEEIASRGITVATVIISATNDIEKAITTMKLGAYDYIAKPINLERIKVILKNITEKLELEREVKELRTLVENRDRFATVIGRSEPIRRILDMLSRVIDTDATILIQGESGTGKGVLAGAVHYASNRSQKPFRTLDLATIPRDLIESELFGHEKGAFTGATARKAGRFELAHGGTLFIDEISNLTFEAQAKLLKVLQEKQFERIGGSEIISVDTRIIAASNRDLRVLVRDGEFREDLYYRLNVFPVQIPPLRDRPEDIPVLLMHFLERFNLEYGKGLTLTDMAMRFLEQWPWPGNVRQLENLVRRMVLLAPDTADVDDVQRFLEPDEHPAVQKHKPARLPLTVADGMTMKEAQRKAIIDALQRTGNNISQAAKLLGISRKSLHDRIRSFGLVIKKTLSD